MLSSLFFVLLMALSPPPFPIVVFCLVDGLLPPPNSPPSLPHLFCNSPHRHPSPSLSPVMFSHSLWLVVACFCPGFIATSHHRLHMCPPLSPSFYLIVVFLVVLPPFCRGVSMTRCTHDPSPPTANPTGSSSIVPPLISSSPSIETEKSVQ